MRLLQGLGRVRSDVLGLNRRNVEIQLQYNRRSLYAVVDHKQRTKEALAAVGLPVPETYAVCGRANEIGPLVQAMGRWEEFVLKPARGAGGEGVVVIAGRDGDAFRTASGRRIGRADLTAHIADIVAGAFALSQCRDEAIVEYRLRSAPEFAAVTAGGVGDIRIVVFRGVPIMGMLRLPTKASDGRANLHAGGIGAGIDLVTGRTRHAILRGRAIEAHPDTGAPVVGWQLPGWSAMVELAARAFAAVPLGYFGVDIVVDARLGPVILELNARPGLAIQLATRRGLRPMIDAIAALPDVEREPVPVRIATGLELTQRVK